MSLLMLVVMHCPSKTIDFVSQTGDKSRRNIQKESFIKKKEVH